MGDSIMMGALDMKTVRDRDKHRDETALVETTPLAVPVVVPVGAALGGPPRVQGGTADMRVSASGTLCCTCVSFLEG